MFGYIAPLKSELRVREFEVYNAYYCAICHAVKRRYGELPRLMLSYDAVLIAMLSDALEEEQPKAPSFKTFRCFNNPLKKRNEAIASTGVEYAADVMVLLGWLSLKDGKSDRDTRGPLKYIAAFAGEIVLRRAGRRAAGRLGEKAKICLECVEEQRVLEAAKTDSLDRAADPTGLLMSEFLDFTRDGGVGTPWNDSDGSGIDESLEKSKILREMGYHIGRYIYYIDAIDDLEKDRKFGAYNPLLLRPETAEALKTAISLDLARLGELTGKLSLLRHKDIIKNIIYLGLRARLDEVFEKV